MPWRRFGTRVSAVPILTKALKYKDAPGKQWVKVRFHWEYQHLFKHLIKPLPKAYYVEVCVRNKTALGDNDLRSIFTENVPVSLGRYGISCDSDDKSPWHHINDASFLGFLFVFMCNLCIKVTVLLDIALGYSFLVFTNKDPQSWGTRHNT